MALDPAPMTQLAARPLFGGAITLALPMDYLDASDLRQIPDNQEVFLSSSSETSVVVEILGMVDEGEAGRDLWEAAKFHFASLAHDNSALSSSISTPGPSSPTPSRPLSSPSTPAPTVLSGTQVIHKFSHNPSGAPRPGREADEPDTVWIGLALWRCWLDPTSDSSERNGNGTAGTRGGQKKADLVLSVNVNLSADGGEAERVKVEAWFMEAVKGLRIRDWGLFADE